MGVRDKLDENRITSLIVAMIAIAIAAAYILHAMARPSKAVQASQAFFTTDDGATVFADDASKLPPFDHDGLPAYRAIVYTCDGGQHHWVQHLEKYSPEAKQRLESSSPAEMSLPPQLRAGGMVTSFLVKRPGATEEWIPSTSAERFEAICKPIPPDGMGTGPVEPFLP